MDIATLLNLRASVTASEWVQGGGGNSSDFLPIVHAEAGGG